MSKLSTCLETIYENQDRVFVDKCRAIFGCLNFVKNWLEKMVRVRKDFRNVNLNLNTQNGGLI